MDSKSDSKHKHVQTIKQIKSINRQKKTTTKEPNKPFTFTLKLKQRTLTTNQQPYSQTPTLEKIITNKTKQLVTTI